MKLKKLFSLSLAAAMLLSTAALPVAADGVTEGGGAAAAATSPYSAFYYDFDDKEWTSNEGVLSVATTSPQRGWNNVEDTNVDGTDNTSLKIKTTAYDYVAEAVMSGDTRTGTNYKLAQTQVNFNTLFNGKPSEYKNQGDAVFGFSLYVSENTYCGLNLKGLSNKWYKDTSDGVTYYDSVSNLLQYKSGKLTYLSGERDYNTGKSLTSTESTSVDEGWQHFVIGIDFADSATTGQTVITIWQNGRKLGVAKVEPDMQGIYYIQMGLTTPEKVAVMDGDTKVEDEYGSDKYYTVENLSDAGAAPTTYTVGLDNVFGYMTGAGITPTYATDIKSTDSEYKIDFGQKVFASDIHTDGTANPMVHLQKGDDRVASSRPELGVSSEEWKDSVTVKLTELADPLKSDTEYDLVVKATDAFGNAILPSGDTVKTEKTYAVEVKSGKAEGGTVTFVDAEGNDLGTTTVNKTEGTKVYAQATPADKYVFTGWTATGTTLQTGDKSCNTPGGKMNNPIEITVPTTAVTLTATFDKEWDAYYNDGSSIKSGTGTAFNNVGEVTSVDSTTIANNADDTKHGKVLEVKHTNSTTANAFINAKVQNARNAVTGYSFWVPADSTDSSKASTSYSVGAVTAKGVSGEWASDQIKANDMIGVTNGVLYYNTDEGGSRKQKKWENADGSSKLTPGWHDIVLAFDMDTKQISYYIDNTYLGTATYSNMTAVNYLAHSHTDVDISYYYDDFFLYYPEDKTVTADKTLAYGTTEYTIDLGQKVTFEGTTVPVTVKRGTTTIAANAELVKGTTKDSVKLTFTDGDGLTDGTYVVNFGTMTDLLGKAVDDIDFDVMPKDAKLATVKFTAGEGGQIKTTVGDKVVTAASNTMVLAAGTEVTVEAIPNDGYVMDSPWTGFDGITITSDKVTLDTSVDHTTCCTKLKFIVPESDANIGVKFHKLAHATAHYYDFSKTDEVTAFKKILTNKANNVAFSDDEKCAKVTGTYSITVDTNKNMVFGFSIKKPATQTEWKLGINAKADNPCGRWFPGYASDTFLQFSGTNTVKCDASSDTLKDDWNDVCALLDFENHKVITWVNGQKLGEHKTQDLFDYATRILMTADTNAYDLKDMYIYYPGEAAAVSAPSEAETHDTEYVIDMGQKVFGEDTVELQKDGTKVDGVTVTKVSDGYKDRIKLTFDGSLLQAGKIYTVKLDGVKDAYNNAITTTNPSFNVKAKSVKVTAEPGNKRMGQVALKQGDAAATSGNSFDENTVLIATATAAENYKFVEWEATGITLTAEQKTNATLSITTPWQNDVTVKAIFKRTTDTAVNAFYWDFEDWDGTTSNGSYKGVSLYYTANQLVKETLDDAHGYSIKTNDTKETSFVTNNKDNVVFGFSFNTDKTGGFALKATGKDTSDWGDNAVDPIVKVFAPASGKQQVNIFGTKLTDDLAEGWHDIAVAVDFRHSTVKVWFDGVEKGNANPKWRFLDRFIIGNPVVAGAYLDNMFMYKQGGNAVETPVNVKAGTNTWTFDVGEMLYDVKAEVKVAGTPASEYEPEVTYVDKYNYKVELNGTDEKWEDGKTYTVEISGTDAFGNEVTKTITANAKTMYTATVEADPETMGSVSIVDKKDAYAQNDTFDVQATIKDTDKYSFKEWKVEGEGATYTADASDKTKATVVVGSAPVTVTAVFQEIPKSDVTVTTDDATKGSVGANTWNATAKKWDGAITQLKPGTQVRVKAYPMTGYKFKEWEVTGVTLTETQKTQNSLVFAMGDVNVSIKAVFEAYEGSQPANSLPLYWDFETAKANAYGTQSGFFINNTGWNDANATIYTTTAYTDAEHGRSLVMGPKNGTEQHFVSIATGTITGDAMVFGFEALVNSESSFGLSQKGTDNNWTEMFSVSGTTLTAKDADKTTATLKNGWNDIRVGIDYANKKIYVYANNALVTTLTPSTLAKAQGFNTQNATYNVAFDNMFAYYTGDAVKLTGEDNVKHSITTYTIAADQLIYQSSLGSTVTLRAQDGSSAVVEAEVTLTNDKTISKLALAFMAGATLKENTTYKIDFSEDVGEGAWTDMLGRELPDYSFKTRSTKPTITVKDATTYEGILPQDTVTDIEVAALNIANDQTLTVYQNGTAVKTLTVSGVTEDDMSYKATVEVTLVGGDNKFEVVWGETKGETTIKARKFATLSTVMDVDFEDGVTSATFGTKNAPNGSLTVIDGDTDHGKVYEVDYPATSGDGGSPFFTSPGSAKATSGIVVTEADFCFVSDAYNLGIFNIKDNSDKWISQYGVKDGEVTSFGTKVATVKSNTWYRMKHLIDIDNGMIYYFMDGRLIDAHAYQINDGGTWKDANGFQYWNQQAGAKGTKFLIDNIEMYRYAEAADFTVTGYGGTERVGVNGTICVNFTQTMDASTLENITITDESGNVVSKLTESLESDGKTYAITVNGLNHNAPYTVTVPETVKTTSGASNAEAKATIWTEKADFSIDKATVTGGTAGTMKVSVDLNGTTADNGYVLVYAFEGTKLVGINYAEVKDGKVQYETAEEVISVIVPLTGTNLTYGVTLVNSLSDLKTLDFMWITD